MTRTSVVSKPSALILGNYRPALTTARELSGLGYRVILGVHPGSTGAEWSRFVDEVLPIPALVAGSGDLNAMLVDIAATRELALIVPISEAALNAVSAAASHIPKHVHLVMPSAETVAVCHDKYRWLLFARRSGIPCPDFAVCSTLAELRAVCETIGYPVVLRPIVAGTRVGKRKAVTLNGPSDEGQLAPHWPDGTSQLLVQKRFSGDRYNIYFGACDGALVREQHTISLRTDRADGSGQTIYGVTIERIPELSDLLAVAVRRMRYDGVGCAQFLYDPATRNACFLEINPRFGASYAFVERIGMNLTRLAVEIATGGPVSGDYPAEGKAGTRFVWTYGDLIGIWYCLRHREIDRRGAWRWAVAALSAAVRADVHVTWSWRDPCPALVFYGGQLRKTLRGFLRATPVPGIRAPAGLPRRA
jgi:predicted ATP-grasp superfamily ATP-dependent carboligase